MNNNLTDITVVLDRSGSMGSIKDDTIGGFNTFLKEQQEAKGEATLTLNQFDDKFEVRIGALSIKEAKPLDDSTFVPRGSTALLDAIGRSIDETGTRLRNTPEADRPSKVVVVVITDGQENASSKYTEARVKEMVNHQKNNYKWEFIFLGADIDSFSVAGAIGVNAANTMNFAKNSIGTQAMYGASSSNLRDFRSGLKPDMAYTEVQKEQQKKAGAK